MRGLLILVCTVGFGVPLAAQEPPSKGMVHVPGMQHPTATETPNGPGTPTQGGQAAFATVSEIVKLLEADPTTDWSKVDLEALRQHLIDMDAVTLRSRVKSTPVSGGMEFEITGEAAVAASVRRIVGAHAPLLEAIGGWRATTSPIPSGMRLAVVAINSGDSATVARIRGLGFIGLLTQGNHHAQHHLLIAKGAGSAAHSHGIP